jgi:hypothetical protein
VISKCVVNGSPLIYLTHVRVLDGLSETGILVLAPDVVMGEIGTHGATDPAVVTGQWPRSTWHLTSDDHGPRYRYSSLDFSRPYGKPGPMR